MAKQRQQGLNPIETQSERERRAYYSKRRSPQTSALNLVDEPVVREQAIETPRIVNPDPVFEFATDSYPTAQEVKNNYLYLNQDAGFEMGIAAEVANFAGELTAMAYKYKGEREKRQSDLRFDAFPSELDKIGPQVLEENSRLEKNNLDNPDNPVFIPQMSEQYDKLGYTAFRDFAIQESLTLNDDEEKRNELITQHLIDNGLTGIDLTPRQEYEMIKDVFMGPPLDPFRNGEMIIGAKEEMRLKFDELEGKWSKQRESQLEYFGEYREAQKESRRVFEGTASEETMDKLMTATINGSFSEADLTNVKLNKDSFYLSEDGKTEFKIFVETPDGGFQFAQPMEELLDTPMGGEIGAMVADKLAAQINAPKIENVPTQITDMASRFAENPGPMTNGFLNVVLPFFKNAGDETFDSWISSAGSRSGPSLSESEKTTLVLAQSLYNTSAITGKSFDPEEALKLFDRINSNDYTQRYRMLISSSGTVPEREYTSDIRKNMQASLKSITGTLAESYGVTIAPESPDPAKADIIGENPLLFEEISRDPLLAGHITTLSIINESANFTKKEKEDISDRLIANMNLYVLTDTEGGFVSFGTGNPVANAEQQALAEMGLKTPSDQIRALLHTGPNLLLRGDENGSIPEKVEEYFSRTMSNLSGEMEYPEGYMEWAVEYATDNLGTIFMNRDNQQNGRLYLSDSPSMEQRDLQTLLVLSNPAVQQKLLNLEKPPEAMEDIETNYKMLYERFGGVGEGNFILAYSDPHVTKRYSLSNSSRSPRMFSVIGVKDTDETEIDLSKTFVGRENNAVFRSPYSTAYKTLDEEGNQINYRKSDITAEVKHGATRTKESGENNTSYLVPWFKGLIGLTAGEEISDSKDVPPAPRFNLGELRFIASRDDDYFESRGLELPEANQIRAQAQLLIDRTEDSRKPPEVKKDRTPQDSPEAPEEAPTAPEEAPEETPQEPVSRDVVSIGMELEAKEQKRRELYEIVEKGNIEYLQSAQNVVDSSNKARFALLSMGNNPNREAIFDALVDGTYSLEDVAILEGRIAGMEAVDMAEFFHTLHLLSNPNNKNGRMEFFDFMRKSISNGLPATRKQDRDITRHLSKEFVSKPEVREWLNASQDEDSAGIYTNAEWGNILEEDQAVILKAMFKTLNEGRASRSSLETGNYDFPGINRDVVNDNVDLTNVKLPPKFNRKNNYNEKEIDSLSKMENVPLDVQSAMELVSGNTVLLTPLSEIVEQDNIMGSDNTKLVDAGKVDPRNLNIDSSKLQQLTQDPNSKFFGKNQTEINKIWAEEYGVNLTQYRLLRDAVREDLVETMEVVKGVLGVEIDTYIMSLLAENDEVYNSVLQGVIDRLDPEGETKSIGSAEVVEAFVSLSLYERYGYDPMSPASTSAPPSMGMVRDDIITPKTLEDTKNLLLQFEGFDEIPRKGEGELHRTIGHGHVLDGKSTSKDKWRRAFGTTLNYNSFMTGKPENNIMTKNQAALLFKEDVKEKTKMAELFTENEYKRVVVNGKETRPKGKPLNGLKFKELSPNLQKFLIAATFRGDWGKSPKARRLLSEGKFKLAAREYLVYTEYIEAERGHPNYNKRPGVRPRMEAVRDAILAEELYQRNKTRGNR